MTKKKSEYKMTESDCQTMHLWQKGQILYLHHQGFTKRDISGVTGRSMDWIDIIIGALVGCDIEQQLIDKYHEHEEEKKNVKSKRKQSTTETQCKRRIRYTSKRTTNKKDSSPIRWGKAGTGKSRRNNGESRQDSHIPEPGHREVRNTGTRSNKRESIVEKMKENKDYAGE